MNTATQIRLAMRSSKCPVTHSPSPNVTRSFGADFHISYNPRSSAYGSDTTAIVLQERVFFVLTGDHSEALCAAAAEHVVKGCIDYFAENITRANGNSEHLMATGLHSDPFNLLPTTLEVIGQEGVDRIAAAVQAKLLADQG